MVKNQPVRLVQHGLLLASLQRPEHAALVCGERRFTYRELRDHALSFAQVLLDRGLERGDRIAIYHDNGWAAVVAVFGTLFAGGAFMFVNPQTKAEKLEYILLDSGARFLVSQHALRHQFIRTLSFAKDLKHLFISGPILAKIPEEGKTLEHFDDLIEKVPPADASDRALSTDIACLLYTSGTTGSPKGVVMSHRSMVFVTESISEYLPADETHRLFGILPLAFGYGLYQMMQAFFIGATLVLERTTTYPAELISRLTQEKVTVFPGVPTLFALLLSLHQKKPLAFPSVQVVTSAAAPLPKAFIPKLREIFPHARLFIMYGQTECTRIAYLEPELIDERPGSVGRAIPGTEVFIRSPDGEPVSANETGLLHVRGEHVMLGYWNQPDLTAKVLKTEHHPYDRVLNTMDWFRMDEQGHLYFVARSDDIIKTRGEKVSPTEVENVLYGIDGVQEAAVIGVRDPVLGNAIHAYVAVQDGANITEKMIKKTCLQHLEDFMVPSRVIFLDELPKTDNGKIRKLSLMENLS
jgi:acyl-CoA synthetase (AMP-forming)/AMP-acid ligase II